MILNKTRLPSCKIGTLMEHFSFENRALVRQLVFPLNRKLESHVLCSDKRKTLCGKDQKRRKECFGIITEH